MKCDIGILFAVTIILCKALIYSFTELHTARCQQHSCLESTPKYDVAVRMCESKGREGKWITWAGAILNKDFVLSVDPFNGEKEIIWSSLQVITGYIHVGKLDRTSITGLIHAGKLNRTTRFAKFNAKLSAKQVWVLKESLLLIKLNVQVNFNTIPKARPINLPEGNFLKMWKNPFFIPNNVEFITSYWCRNKNSPDYKLKIGSIKRRCDKKTCFYNNALVPTCISIETDAEEICVIPAGAPIVYNNTLVGLRKYSQIIVSGSETSDSYFINVAYYKELILTFVEGSLKCSINEDLIISTQEKSCPKVAFF